MTTPPPSPSLERWAALTAASPQAVRLLLVLQGVLTAGLALGLLLAARGFALELPYGPLGTLTGGYGLGTAAAALWHRRRPGGDDEAATGTVTALLLSQLAVLTGALYYTGGASSPFTSLYLITLALGAMVLPWPRAVALTVLALIAYALLFRFYVPLAAQAMESASALDHSALDHSAHEGTAGAGFTVHVLGMGLNFLLSSVVLVGLLARLAAMARTQGARLATLEAQALRNAHVVALGGVAASAAHALSTPLSTAAITLEGLQEEAPLTDEQRSQVTQTLAQIQRGRSRLTEALRGAQLERLEAAASARPLAPRLATVLEGWRLLHPELTLETTLALVPEARLLDPAFEDTVTTLLNNAAEANATQGATTLRLEAKSAQGWLTLTVEDQGQGPAPGLPGAPVTSQKPYGAGAGLLLAQANLERLGGKLTVEAGATGWRATLRLPLVDGHG
jgi:two-component system sensor histidine kinase RegB